MFLYLLLLSCIVASIRESANILFLFTPNLHNSIQKYSVTQPINIKIYTLRGHSNTTSSTNSREFSSHSDVLSRDYDYVDKVYILANNPSWADQVEMEKLQKPSLSYTFLKEVKDTININIVLVVETLHISHITNSVNTCTLQGIETLAIPYLVNQQMDLLL